MSRRGVTVRRITQPAATSRRPETFLVCGGDAPEDLPSAESGDRPRRVISSRANRGSDESGGHRHATVNDASVPSHDSFIPPRSNHTDPVPDLYGSNTPGGRNDVRP